MNEIIKGIDFTGDQNGDRFYYEDGESKSLDNNEVIKVEKPEIISYPVLKKMSSSDLREYLSKLIGKEKEVKELRLKINDLLKGGIVVFESKNKINNTPVSKIIRSKEDGGKFIVINSSLFGQVEQEVPDDDYETAKWLADWWSK